MVLGGINMKRLILIALLLISGCGTTAYQVEYDAYKAHLQQQEKMTTMERDYLLARKYNDIQERCRKLWTTCPIN